MEKVGWLIIGLMFVISTISYFFWESTTNVGATGTVNPSTITYGNIFFQVWGRNSAGGNVWIGCIIKPDANGNWYILGGNHQNVGCTDVSQSDTGITISHTALSKVVTSSVDSDESLVVSGYNAGASVGLSSSIIMIGN